MIISVWKTEDEQRFTLTFTSVKSHESTTSTEPSGCAVVRTAAGAQRSPGSSSDSPLFGRRSTHVLSSLPTMTSLVSQTSSFSSSGLPSRETPSSAPSIPQKATQLKDSMLNAMNMPAYAMWKDGSFGIPNRAILELCPGSESEIYRADNQREWLSMFKAWTEDFQQELSVDDFPIVQLCRTQKPFNSRRVGMKHPKTGARIVYDVSGETVRNERTGEFLGGLVTLKDVTQYTERIAAQTQENERQFETIVNMIPPMVWTTAPSGEHDWFSQRWYEYTGLTVGQSIGPGWRLPFHDEDMPEVAKQWQHSLTTGVRSPSRLHTFPS